MPVRANLDIENPMQFVIDCAAVLDGEGDPDPERLHLIFPCLMLLSERDGNSRTGQIEEAGNGKIALNIQ